MSKIINIDTVQEDFLKWRKHKKSGERIPNHLWALIREIWGHYSSGSISHHRERVIDFALEEDYNYDKWNQSSPAWIQENFDSRK